MLIASCRIVSAMAAVSVVITVKNEEASISRLLGSLQNQSLKPREVIIVDGGSTDKTVDIVRSFIGSRSLFKLIVAKGVNRGQGRNIGIEAATSDIIALTDAGVVLDRFWLEKLFGSLKNEGASFVGGVYVQGGESLLQKCIGILQYPNLEKLHVDNFLPSCRSVAFTKKVWKAVGQWPENLEKAEDTYFDLKVIEKGFKTALAKDAVVYWPARDSLRGLFLQYSSYAEWDAKACLLTKLRIYKHLALAHILVASFLLSTIFFGFWSVLLLFSIVFAYLVISGAKAYMNTHRVSSFFLAAAIKVTIFSAETYGVLKGLVNRVF